MEIAGLNTKERTDGCFATITEEDKESDEQYTDTTCCDIGDVTNGTVISQPWNTTRWIDPNRGGGGRI
jgi:hypothetical protein